MAYTDKRVKNDRGGNAGRGGGRGRGAAGAGSKSPQESREVQVSKALSYLLRHGAKGVGVEFDDGGWACLTEVLQWRKLSNLSVTLSEIQSLIETNDKQRFAIKPNPAYNVLSPSSPSRGNGIGPTSFHPCSPSDDPSAWLIRASQGHSLDGISSEKLLSAFVPGCPGYPANNLVVHGTNNAALEKILASGGLKPMSRLHIHFATSLPAALPPLDEKTLRVTDARGEDTVLSGMRRGATVLIWVNLRASREQGGVRWWQSTNGVVLTEGVDGILPLRYVRWVERRGTGEVLWGTKPAGGGAALATAMATGSLERVNGSGGHYSTGMNGGDGSVKNGDGGDEVLHAVKGLRVNGDGLVEAEDGGASVKDSWDD